MKVGKYRRTVLGTLASSVLFAGPTFAQSAATPSAPAGPDASLDRVEVIGIRASLLRAQESKRNSAEIVDAISAEDVGKFPDKNLAEALQRVPGVTIDRNRGEGNFVSVRGLPPAFVRGSVNGRTLVSATESFNSTLSGGSQSSTGRETNFDVLPSEIVDVLQVFKSNSAEQVEGGIAGVVNVLTARPLSYGNKLVFSASDLYSQLSKKHAPNLSGLWSWRNEERTFGALVSLTASERHIRQGSADSFAYSPSSTFGMADAYDTRAGGSKNAGGVLFPFSFNPQNFTEDRRNEGFNGTLQWRPSAKTDITLDALYQHRSLSYVNQQAIFLTTPVLAGVIFPAVTGVFGPTNADGSVQFPSLVVGPTNTASRYQTAADVTATTDRQSGSDRSLNLGLNAVHRLDDWKLSADLSQAQANGNENFDRAAYLPKAGGNELPGLLTVTTTGGNIAATPSAAFAAIISDPSKYQTNNFQQDRRRNKDTEKALRLDAERDLEGGLFSAVKFGVRFSQRTKDLNVTGLASGNFKDANGVGVSQSLQSAPGGIGHLPSDLVPGKGIGFDPATLPFAQDPAAVIAALGALAAPGTLNQVFNPLQSYSIDEKTSAAYGQLDIDTKLGGTPITGNVGVRYVRTSTDGTGYRRPFTIVSNNGIGNIQYSAPDVTTLSSSGSDAHALPSLNLKAELSKDLAARFAYSKSLTRPLFSDLTPAYTGAPNPTQRTAAVGNPDLKPVLGDNYDVSAEWYQANHGVISVGGFYKKLKGIVGSTTSLNTTYDGNQWVSLSKPGNLGTGKITGGEIGMQMPLTFLPDPWDGFGVIANYTRTNGSSRDGAGADLPLVGVSKYSLNAAAYYEKGPFQVRLAYTYRDDYLLLNSDVFAQQVFVKGYGQADLSAAYDLNKSLSLFANVLNLTSSKEVLYSSNKAFPGTADTRPQAASDVGRRFFVGMRIKL